MIEIVFGAAIAALFAYFLLTAGVMIAFARADTPGERFANADEMARALRG